jgi:hypothetical protein
MLPQDLDRNPDHRQVTSIRATPNLANRSRQTTRTTVK